LIAAALFGTTLVTTSSCAEALPGTPRQNTAAKKLSLQSLLSELSKRVIFRSANEFEEDGTHTLAGARHHNRLTKKTGLLTATSDAIPTQEAEKPTERNCPQPVADGPFLTKMPQR
jgi:hypothetical protein